MGGQKSNSLHTGKLSFNKSVLYVSSNFSCKIKISEVKKIKTNGCSHADSYSRATPYK